MKVLFTTAPNGKWVGTEIPYTQEEIEFVLATPLLRDKNLATVNGVLFHKIWLDSNNKIWCVDDMKWVSTNDVFKDVWAGAIND